MRRETKPRMRRAPGTRDVEPVWMDIDQCGDSHVSIPAGPSSQTWTWSVNRPGPMLTVGGHVHDYGVNLEVRNITTNQVICDSLASFGTDPLSIDHTGFKHISRISTCGGPGQQPIAQLAQGNQVRITSNYNTPAAVPDAMGIAVLDASHPAVRRASRPLVARATAGAAAIDAALEARDAELVAAGHRPQVERVAGLAPVFVIEEGVKRRLRVGEALPAGHELAPNVLLRPVVERSILPTVAYLAGPGELAYFAQVSAVADSLGAAPPLALARWSVTIIEDHAAKLLRRLDTTEEELRDPHAAAQRLARAAMPASVERALDTMRATVAAELGRVSDDPEAAALLPPRALEGAGRALAHRLDRIERRFLAAVKRDDVRLMTDLATARGYFFPHDGRQERVLNFLPFLARQGRPLLEAMCDEATRYARTHVQ